MELEIVRRIRGNVHGTIDVTALEDKVLDHPVVQRLRRIKQLAFLSFVFPGATHTRFEHSLGVMQLAGITWDKLWANQKRLAHSCDKHNDFAATEQRGIGGLVHGLLAPTFSVIDEVFSSSYTQQALRLAALLHDLGHPPFSHSFERFMPTWKTLLSQSKGVPPYLMEFLQRRCDNMAARGKDPLRKKVRKPRAKKSVAKTFPEKVSETPSESQTASEIDKASSSPKRKALPVTLRDMVFRLYDGQCCFESEDGKRCEERTGLQVDHIVPVAKGGTNNIKNLRLLCRIHNMLMARRQFGKTFIEKKIAARVAEAANQH